MTGDAREADKKRRRAEALRANLKRRKAASGTYNAPPMPQDGARAESNAFEAKASERDTRGN